MKRDTKKKILLLLLAGGFIVLIKKSERVFKDYKRLARRFKRNKTKKLRELVREFYNDRLVL